MKVRKIIRSILSYFPLLKKIIPNKGTGGSNSAEYCLNIYSKHKSMLIDAGCIFPIEGLAEIGPGDSIGIGLVAIFEGTSKYYALDAIKHATKLNNISVFEDLYKTYRKNGKPIDNQLYETISAEIRAYDSAGGRLQYAAPWTESNILSPESIDVIFSTAVMEHIIDLEGMYRNIFNWLKPGGYTSHIIDYAAHEFSDIWYQHWEYSDPFWKFLMHGRKYPINRKPHSQHIKCLMNVGFQIITDQPIINKTTFASKNKINSMLRDQFTEEDTLISASSIVAKKPLV